MAVIWFPDESEKDKSSIDDTILPIKTAVYGKDVRGSIYDGLNTLAKSMDHIAEDYLPIFDLATFIEKYGVEQNLYINGLGKVTRDSRFSTKSIEIPTNLYPDNSSVPVVPTHSYKMMAIEARSSIHVSFLKKSINGYETDADAPLCDANESYTTVSESYRDYKILNIPDNCQYILLQKNSIGDVTSSIYGYLSEYGTKPASLSYVLMSAIDNLVSKTAPTGPYNYGIPGNLAISDQYLYVCVGHNIWKRIELSSF